MIFEYFPSSSDLLATEKNVKCSQEGCLKTFIHTGALNMHLIKSHGLVKTAQDKLLYSSIKGKKIPDGSFKYFCPADRCIYKKESNRYFTTFKLLKQHYQKVHAEKVFKCEKCPAAFGLERELRRHVGHCGVLYKCGSCPVTYTTKETLQSHCNRKEHTFPEEYASQKSKKQKSRNKTATSMATSEPKPVPVAVLVVGLPTASIQSKLPKAILPKSIQNTIQGMNVGQEQAVETASKDSETPVRQHAVMQTEIYGVENLAVEGRENNTEKTDKSIVKPVHKITKGKTDKENSPATRSEKSTTGMQTSVSLFPRKGLKTVTGTQTSGDYILKKAMASADIPIQRKTVASQVTPQKSVPKISRKRETCSSETQTGVSPEKVSKIDSGVNSSEGPVENILLTADQMEDSDSLDNALSASAQTLESYIKEKNPDVNIMRGNILSLSPNGNLIIKPFLEDHSNDLSESTSSDQASRGNVCIIIQEQGKVAKSSGSNASEKQNSDSSVTVLDSSESVHGLSDTTSSFLATLGLRSMKQVSCLSADSRLVGTAVQHTSNSISNASDEPRMKGNSTTNTSTKRSYVDDCNFVSKQKKSITDNTSAAPFNSKGKQSVQKGRKTIRNLLDDSAKNNISTSESTLPPLRPVISTTSGITFSNNILTYSNLTSQQQIGSAASEAGQFISADKGETPSNYDSHKLYNPVKDSMLSDKANENSNTIDMEAQTMSATEFEQLLLASGIIVEPSNLQTVNETANIGFQKQAAVYDSASIVTEQGTSGLVHKGMETETLAGPDFDFFSENSALIDMNTQTITDFSRLLDETYGPTDSDTQTVTDIDFLDLVMTNMETQTLSDRDLIDLGLMDPDQASEKPSNDETDALKSSETQTSFNTQQAESTTGNTDNANENVELSIYVQEPNKIANGTVTNLVTEKTLDATTSSYNGCDNSKDVTLCDINNLGESEKPSNSIQPPRNELSNLSVSDY